MKVKEKLRKVFSSKAFYIVFSLLASVTIWLYVGYVENPDVTVGVRGLKVVFLNKEFLNDRSLVVTKTNADTVSLWFQGKRNTVSALTNANIKVTADLSEIKSPGVYQIQYKEVYPIDINPDSLSVTGRSTDYITVNVDTLVKKDIQVRGSYNGGVAEGYQAEPMEITPGTITVSGPGEIVNRVSYALVTVLREKLSKTIEDSLPIALMDDSGRSVQSSQLQLSQESVKIKIPVVMVKNVPLTVKLSPGAGADTTNTVVTITPASIPVSGDAATLNSLNQIVLGTIDLTKFLTTANQTYKIALPNGTINLTGTAEALVNVAISGLDSRHVAATNIQVANTPSGYTATVVTTNVDVTLRGKADALPKLLPTNVRIVADLSELGASTGIYSVLGKIYVDGDSTGVGAIGDYKIAVMLTKT